MPAAINDGAATACSSPGLARAASVRQLHRQRRPPFPQPAVDLAAVEPRPPAAGVAQHCPSRRHKLLLSALHHVAAIAPAFLRLGKRTNDSKRRSMWGVARERAKDKSDGRS